MTMFENESGRAGTTVGDQAGFAVSRRGALGALAGLAFTASTARASTPERPNILWLVSEDNNPFIGAYGDSIANTPTIDRLAASGILYRNVFANAPVCAPSRFAILTGIHPESCAPANQMRAVAHLPEEFRTYPELLREAGYFCTNNAKTDYNCDVDPDAIWDVQGNTAHWRQRPDGRPFMAVVNHMVTHESRLFRPTAGRVTPGMVTVPPYLPDTPVMREQFASYYNMMEIMDGQVAETLAQLEGDGLADDTIVFYYSDNGGSLPRSKRYCTDAGMRAALVIYAPRKWQHLLPAPPGSQLEDPVTLLDLAPSVLALAGVAQPPQMQGLPLLGPTAPEVRRLAFGMRNRMDERIDFQRTVTDGRWRYTRNYMPHLPLGQHQAFAWLAPGYQEWETAYLAGTLNSDQARFFEARPFEELYDLAADPHELQNLAGSGGAASVQRMLSGALDEHMLAINDNGFLPEGMEGEGWVASRNQNLYPLRALMQLGEMAARGNPADLPVYLDSLESPVPVVRYWAAMGLRILGHAAAPARDVLVGLLAQEPDNHVRIVACEVLAELGADDLAVQTLMGMATEDVPWAIQLHALNALTHIGEKALPALSLARSAAQSERSEYVRSAGLYLELRLTGEYRPQTPVFDYERLTNPQLPATAGAGA